MVAAACWIADFSKGQGPCFFAGSFAKGSMIVVSLLENYMLCRQKVGSVARGAVQKSNGVQILSG